GLAAAAAFAAVREAPGATAGGADALAEALRSVALLGRDAAFRRFVITRTLLLATALSMPFYVALAVERTGTGAAGFGLLLAASGVAGAVSAPVWGHLADRSSRRVMIAAALATGALGIAVFALDAAGAAALRHEWSFAALFFLTAVAHAGARLGRKTYLVDLADERTRAAYVAVSNSVIGLLLLAGSAFGAVAELLGTPGVILVLALLALAAAASAVRLPEVEE
ncbi:MAG: MFS transporter, partial [Burkholderiales bacterium]|nr:MFS transporter [Burkholderiales bacterium]